MFLIISKIYLFLYRTHVKYKKNGKLACKIELAESTKIVRDIPKIIKFKATTSLRVSCLFCIFKHSVRQEVV